MMGLPTDPYKWGDQKKTIQERMQGFDVKPSPAQPEDTTPPPGTPPNPEQIQTPEGAVDDAMAPTYGEPRQKTPEELEENPGVVRVHGINPDALDPSLAGGVPQQVDQPQPGAPQTLSAQEYPKRFEETVSSQNPASIQHGSGRCTAVFKTQEEADGAEVLLENDPFFKGVKKNGLTVSAQWGDVDGHRLEDEEMSKDVNKAALAEFGARSWKTNEVAEFIIEAIHKADAAGDASAVADLKQKLKTVQHGGRLKDEVVEKIMEYIGR